MDEDDIYAQNNDQSENGNEQGTNIANLIDSTITSSNQQTTQNFTFLSSEKKFCFIGNDADHIPATMIYEFGLKSLVLDVSFNCLSDLRDLHQFPYLEELVVDNNLISEETEFPKLENLKLFSCNKNNIKNIHLFIDKIKVNFPRLRHLSMLGNEACPNQLVDPSKDEYDYSRYRKYVLYRIRTLKFLDNYEVTPLEREIIDKDSLFYDVVTMEESNLEKSDSKISYPTEKNSLYSPLPLPSKDSEAENSTPHSSFGHSKYTYLGKQSEGNRFIRNDDL